MKPTNIEITLRTADYDYVKRKTNIPHTVVRSTRQLTTFKAESTYELHLCGLLTEKAIPHDSVILDHQAELVASHKYRVLANGETQLKCPDEPESILCPMLGWHEQVQILTNRDKTRSYLKKLNKDDLFKLVRQCASKIFKKQSMIEELTTLIISKGKDRQISYILSKGFKPAQFTTQQ